MKTLPDINKRKLWELARAGKSATEIMRTLEIKDKAVFRYALHHVILESGEPFRIPGMS